MLTEQPGIQTTHSHVFVVDDYPDNLFLIEMILDSPRYHLSFAKGGTEALERISQSPPDILLLDLMMPDMSGYEVAQQIRQNPSLPRIPILLLTASNEIRKDDAQRVGIDEVIYKPLSIEELRRKVRSLLKASAKHAPKLIAV